MGGNLILIFVCLLCAATFTAIGAWAARSKTPVHFWAGEKLDPKTLSDVSSYNRENSRMWLQYAILWWLCVILSLVHTFVQKSWIAVAILVIMVLSCTFGMIWLVKTYTAIFARYKVEKT